MTLAGTTITVPTLVLVLPPLVVCYGLWAWFVWFKARPWMHRLADRLIGPPPWVCDLCWSSIPTPEELAQHKADEQQMRWEVGRC